MMCSDAHRKLREVAPKAKSASPRDAGKRSRPTFEAPLLDGSASAARYTAPPAASPTGKGRG